MTETITIPLSKLAPWTGNVRRTSANDGIEELAASIAAHGLLQSLVVRKGKRGKYEIVAGRRRYLALTKLAADRTIDKDYAVPCMLASGDIDATELSLHGALPPERHPHPSRAERRRPGSPRKRQIVVRCRLPQAPAKLSAKSG